MDHNLTPRMTRHALARCQEMGIPARLAKGIWRRATLTYQTQDDRTALMVTSKDFPGYAIVVAPARSDGHPQVVTVLFHTEDDYTRQGGTYTTKDQ